jgi:hypothetical protein
MNRTALKSLLLEEGLLKNASNDYVAIFDSLRPGQTIEVALTSVMGMGSATDGTFREWKVGRKSRSKKYNSEAITLMPMDGSKPNKFNAFRLWKRSRRDHRTGEEKPGISASHGDMGIMIKGIRT